MFDVVLQFVVFIGAFFAGYFGMMLLMRLVGPRR